tara:strand:- start:241 stop:411 length:171 start_codon:yes stop_codon:yes gene_type:complete
MKVLDWDVELGRWKKPSDKMVPGDRIELPTRGFSIWLVELECINNQPLSMLACFLM